ncbi:MAG: glycosyltransferase family 39 protein [Victivallaceae bacterium]
MRDRAPRDEQFYIEIVEKINNNDKSWYKEYELPPLVPLTASVLCHVGFSAENSLRLLNMLYSIIWIGVMFFLCRDVFDSNKAGLFGMAIAAFNPYSARLACQILREPLYLLIFTLCLWCTVLIIKGKCGNFLYPAIVGVLTVLGFFTRIEGIEIIVFVPLAAVVVYLQYNKMYFWKCFATCAVFFLTIASLVAVLIVSGNYYLNEVVLLRLNEYYRLFAGGHL